MFLNKLNRIKIFIDGYCIDSIYDLSIYDLQKLIDFSYGIHYIKIYKYYDDRCEFKEYTCDNVKLNDKSSIKILKLIKFKVDNLYKGD